MDLVTRSMMITLFTFEDIPVSEQKPTKLGVILRIPYISPATSLIPQHRHSTNDDLVQATASIRESRINDLECTGLGETPDTPIESCQDLFVLVRAEQVRAQQSIVLPFYHVVVVGRRVMVAAAKPMSQSEQTAAGQSDGLIVNDQIDLARHGVEGYRVDHRLVGGDGHVRFGAGDGAAVLDAVKQRGLVRVKYISVSVDRAFVAYV
ncbi:MAG: hypothetical protein M1816_001913 [Peltula sp. TS41687]|nr:MAG: hypothetical protein M1816_001913 [Peltula sp. TS41687]